MSEDFGKVDAEFFEEHIYPNLGAERDSIAIGPRHGVDFGVLEVGSKRLVVASDPISIQPALGFRRAGELALHSVLSDVAISGIPPAFLSVNLMLPMEMTDAEFAEFWEGIAAECEELGIGLVSGHTARQDVSYPWVGGATAMGVGDPDEIVRPDGARPGNSILLTKGPGVEVAGLFATLFGDELDVAEDHLERAAARLEETSLVGDALAAADAAPVSAMHDATECGLQGALVEMAEAAGVGFELSSRRVPEPPDVLAICESLDLDPWQVSSRGTLVITAPESDADSVVNALEDRGTPVEVIGEVTDGGGVTVDGDSLAHPGTDPAWDAFGALLSSGEE